MTFTVPSDMQSPDDSPRIDHELLEFRGRLPAVADRLRIAPRKHAMDFLCATNELEKYLSIRMRSPLTRIKAGSYLGGISRFWGRQLR